MKIAVAGKGGVGKTTLAASLASHLSLSGRRVTCIDADPSPTLAWVMGAARDRDVVPISEMRSLIAERTGAGKESYGAYFKLNPKVDDIPDRYALDAEGVRILTMGVVRHARQGCVCPESALLRELTAHVLTTDNEVVILDMEAGTEHLGRGTAASVDAMIVVCEPTQLSATIAGRIAALAGELGIERVLAVVNRIENAEDLRLVEEALPSVAPIGHLPFEKALRNRVINPSTYPDLERPFSDGIKGIADGLCANSADKGR